MVYIFYFGKSLDGFENFNTKLAGMKISPWFVNKEPKGMSVALIIKYKFKTTAIIFDYLDYCYPRLIIPNKDYVFLSLCFYFS